MGRRAFIFEMRKPRLRGKTGIFKVKQQVSDRSNNHALVWAQSCRPCTALPLLVHSCHLQSHHHENWLDVYAVSQVSCPIFLLPLRKHLKLWALVPFQILPALVPVNCPGWGQAISFPLWSWNSLFQEVVICPVQVPGYPQIAPQRHAAILELDLWSSSPYLCPSSSLCFISLLPESCPTFIAQQAPQAKVM